jgi:hypothetical protein
MSKELQAAAQQPALVEVVLDKAHEHAGKQYKAGEKIKVTEDQKAWLVKHGVIGGQQKEQGNE